MSGQYQYYGSGSHMSADMKATYRRVRAAHGQRYRSKKVQEHRFDEHGVARVVTVQAQPEASPMSPQARHAFCRILWGADILSKGR